MTLPAGWKRLFRVPFRDPEEERAIREEVSFHLEELVRRFEEAGLPPAEARRRARDRFGEPGRWTREALLVSRARVRVRHRRDVLLGFGSDLRNAFRQIGRRPVFTALMLTVMTVGVAAGTTVWAVADAILFRPLPFPEADRVVVVMGSNRRSESWWLSRQTYDAYRSGQRSFQRMAAYDETVVTLLDPHPDDISALRVESSFFDVIRTRPLLGRAFTPDDDEPDAPQRLILTYDLWKSRFGSDPGVIGRRIRLGSGSAMVIGVMPPSFRWEAEQWDGPASEGAEELALVNRVFRGATTGSPVGDFLLLGRLRPGVSVQDARTDLDGIAKALIDEYPVEYGDAAGSGPLMPNVQPVRWLLTRLVRGEVLLLGVSVLLLLILIAVNSGGLLTTRALDRRSELAVRASLGAGRRRLARQILIETGVLWVIALGVGLVLSAAALPFVRAITPPGTPLVRDFTLRPRVLLGAAFVAFALWVLSSIVPTMQGRRVDLLSLSRSASGRSTSGPRRLQRGLIVVQIGLACGLLTGAGLLVRGYAGLRSVTLGVTDARHVALEYVVLPKSFREVSGTMADVGGPSADAARWYKPTSPLYRPGPHLSGFVSGVLERLRAVPGVEGATFVNQHPFSASRVWLGARIPIGDGDSGRQSPWFRVKWVAPGYFQTLGIPIVKGRALLSSDGPGGPRVLVVNQPFVRRVLAGGDPLGKVLALPFPSWVPPTRYTIVGVVPPVLQYGPQKPEEPVVYMPVTQIPQHWVGDQIGFTRAASFLIRFRGAWTDVLPRLRAAVWAVQPDLPIRQEATLEELYKEETAQPRFFLVLLSAFGGVGLLLSVVGVSAALGQHVRHRTREIGVRRAFGADARDLLRRTLADGARLGLLGAVLGTGLGWLISRAVSARVIGVPGWSPWIQLVVVLTLGLTGLLAALPPALKAIHVDPIEALRSE